MVGDVGSLYTDPFHDIDHLIVENAIAVETNLDAVCQLEQQELDSYRTQKEADGDDEDDEDAWEPEDRPRNLFDVFNHFDDEPSL